MNPICCLTCKDYSDKCCIAHGHVIDDADAERFYCAYHQKLERVLLYDSGRQLPDLMLED